MQKPNYQKDYLAKIKKILSKDDDNLDLSQKMAEAVGGNFDSIGYLEARLLIEEKLRKTDTLIDVGCGSGRLATNLLDYLDEGKYIGLDVVPELHQYAKQLCAKSNFIFYDAPGLTIPEPDNSADLICFFSVMTHLTHKESYLYIKEAKRVLKHQGKIIISFLESIKPRHWKHFTHYVEDNSDTAVLNQFIERDTFQMWCALLNLKIDKIYDGGSNNVPIDRPIDLNGTMYYNHAPLGQSVVVLSKI